MTDYFHEMSWKPLAEGESPNHLLHLARLLRDFGMFEELGEGKRLPPSTSKEVIKNLPQITITYRDSQCPICLKVFKKGEQAKELPCKHHYHACCILPWLDKTNTCPFCRFELPTDDEQYEEYRKAKLREKERAEEIKKLHESMFS